MLNWKRAGESGKTPVGQNGARLSANERGYGARWQKARRIFLARPEHALCVDCKADGILTPATVVDHIRPHRGDQILFWDETNWAGRCARHHNQKTRRGY